MINQISAFVIFTILYCACAQSNPKYKYSTNNQRNKDDATHIVTFPEPVPEDEQDFDLSMQDSLSVIPFDILEKMNQIENISQFIDEFVDDNTTIVGSRFGNTNIERSSADVAKPAICKPDLTVVPLKLPHNLQDPTIIHYPVCTRVKRCGGCCTQRLYSCQPIEKKDRLLTVIITQYSPDSRLFINKGIENVIVEEHTKCQCKCKITEKDCSTFQKYDANQCMCVCTNNDEQTKCYQEKDKYWDPQNCLCRCRESQDCTTGKYFDENLCRCQENYFYRF